MYFTIKKGGFTLFELLVAVAVSSIIVIGLFELFENVMDTRTFALKRSGSMEVVSKTISLMEKDIRCKTGKFSISNALGISKLSFETTNSLKFAGSVPVKVSYYIYNYSNKTYLVREETNERAGEDMKIKLSDMFKKIKFRFYSNGDWTDSPSKIIKIYLYTKSKDKFVFTARGMLNE